MNLTTTDIIAILGLLSSFLLGVWTIRGEYRSAKEKKKTDTLAATDEIASGARTLVEITRDEWERERKKRMELEREIEGIKSAFRQSINCALILHGQLLRKNIEPLCDPTEIRV